MTQQRENETGRTANQRGNPAPVLTDGAVRPVFFLRPGQKLSDTADNKNRENNPLAVAQSDNVGNVRQYMTRYTPGISSASDKRVKRPSQNKGESQPVVVALPAVLFLVLFLGSLSAAVALVIIDLWPVLRAVLCG